MQKIIVWTLYFLTFALPLAFVSSSFELFEFPKFILLLASTLVITAAWAIHFYQAKTSPLTIIQRPSAITIAILAILATQLLSTIFSINPYTSFWGYYTRFHGGLLTTICYTIIYFAALTWMDTKSTQKLIKISIKTSILISLIGIFEHYNLSLTCMLMTGISRLQNSLSPFIMSTACWGNLTNPLSRSFATIGQPNWLAAYLIPNFFLLLYSSKTHKTKNWLIPSTLYAILYTAILFTKSRSGLLAFGLAYPTYWLLLARQYSFAKIKQPLLLISSFLILISLIFGTPFFGRLSFSGGGSSQPTPPPAGTQLDNGGTESGDIRQIVWSGALSLISKYPLLGTGPETFAYTYYWVRPAAHNLTSEWDYIYNKAHNEYLNLAATTGVIGLLVYLYWHWSLLATSFTRIPKSKKVNQSTDDYLRSFSPVLGASLISFAITNFFGFSVIPVYFMMIVLSVLYTSSAKAPEKWLQTRSSLGGPLLIILFLIYPTRLFWADHLYAKGKGYLDAGQPALALPLLQRALSIRPSLDLFHSTMGETYAALGRTNLALKEADLTRKENKYHLNYFKSRAKIYLTLASKDPKYNELAATELEEARTLAPTDPKLAYNLGLVYTRLEDVTKAETQLREAIFLKPNYAEPYYALTLLFEQTKQLDKIVPLLTSAHSHLATYSGVLRDKIEKYTN